MQSRNIVDNTYGTGAVGWPSGHTFGNLTGSDQADFRFTDSKGNVVLDVMLDYISAATSAKFGDGVTINYPSGYGTLGALGGDGKMITGSASNILSVHTTFSDTLNLPMYQTGFTVNSPLPESANPTWNYVDGYHIIISKDAFGANGFGNVTVPLMHNSPPKIGRNAWSPTNVCSCVLNTATAFAVQGTAFIAQATASAQVCFGSTSPVGGGTVGTLGGIVWDDTNKDGIRQGGEKGKKDVDVELYNCAGTKLKKTKTNAQGNYSFTGLAAGQYQIKFIRGGRKFSPSGAGKDSDANPVTGRTICITLGAGAADLGWNAGIHK